MRYLVKAVRGESEVVDLPLEATDPGAARAAAAALGYSVLSIRARAGTAALFGRVRAERFPVPLFAIELLALLEAGLNLVEALRALAQRAPEGLRRRTLEALLAALRAGLPFSRALEQSATAFPPMLVAVVRAAERTGDLRPALERWIAWTQAFDEVRTKLRAALVYPAVLAVAGALVMLFLVSYVVPRFARIYEDLSGSLPFFSAVLLSVGGAIDRHGVSIAMLALGLALAGAWALAQAPLRARIAMLAWRVPALGKQLRLYQLARLYRTLGMLLGAGIAIVPAMEMTAGLLPAGMRRALGEARARVAEGQALSVAMAQSALSTPVAEQMMAVGERSGAMGAMLARVAAFIDADLSRTLDRSMRLFEPLLMVAIGLAVGLVVVLMYMPVFELAGSLQR